LTSFCKCIFCSWKNIIIHHSESFHFRDKVLVSFVGHQTSFNSWHSFLKLQITKLQITSRKTNYILLTKRAISLVIRH
jgi:hypothetical protein